MGEKDREARIAELMELAKQETTTKPKKEKTNDVHKFIIAKNIKEGSTKIDNDIIYYTYVLWCNSRKPISKKSFLQTMNGIFKKRYQKSYNGCTWRGLYLNPEPFDLSEDFYWRAKKHLRLEKQRNAKKSNKEKATIKKK